MLLLRCPGSNPPLNRAAEKISVDIYVTPRELVRNERVSGDTAMLVQAFCQEFALPHLEHFTERCQIESIRAPKPRRKSLVEYFFRFTDSSSGPAESINLNGPNHLPAFASPVKSRIQCTALSADAKPDTSNNMRHLSPSAAIRESAMLTPGVQKMHPPNTATSVDQPSSPASVCQCSIRQCRPADAFLYTVKEKIAKSIPLVTAPSDAQAQGPPLISLGPNTDAILDRFSLGDDLLPRLHTLVGTIRSSHWEAVLRAAPWNLTYEQASNLSNALSADLKGTPGFSITTVFFFPSFGRLSSNLRYRNQNYLFLPSCLVFLVSCSRSLVSRPCCVCFTC